MKGWQYRWFVLDYNAGLLSYYTVGSSRRFVLVGAPGVEVAAGCPPKARCLSGVGVSSGTPLYTPILPLANHDAHRRPTGQSNGSITSTLPLLWLVC